jgi:tetratricopeptide (TPR) repeat protein
MSVLRMCLLTAALLGGCVNPSQAPRANSEGRITVSLLGKPLHPEKIPADRRARLETELRTARSAFDVEPSEEATIWLGRRLAYLGRYDEAIAIYTDGVRRHPGSYRLLRHRGHRLITLRRFDEALRDLTGAAELMRGRPDAIEPDGAPNERNLPRSTDHSNIYYHLGLVRYLRGDWEGAERAFAQREGLAAFNDDMLVSTAHWRYLALRRLGRDAEASAVLAPIHSTMDIVENHGYSRLCRMYKGELSPERLVPAAAATEQRLDAATAYGVAFYLALEGRHNEARQLLQRIIAETSWGAFGHIAAEADLARSPGEIQPPSATH